LRATSLTAKASELPQNLCALTTRNHDLGNQDQLCLDGSSMRLIAESLRILLIAVLALAAGVLRAQDVTTWHNDNFRSGVQPVETILTPSNVNSTTFGKVFSFPVSGAVYAQPLYLSQYVMNDGQMHNVVLIATAEDYVYAFDADGNNPAQGYLWRQSMLGPGETWVTSKDVNVTDITPNIGIIGTPVVNRAGGVFYFVAKSKTTSSPVQFYQRLHALNIADGTEALNGPTLIQATVNGTGDNGTTISFSALLNNQRASLLLAPTPGVGSGNSVIVAWGSHGDLGIYHGWIMAYDAANIATQNAAWCTTPNGKADVNKGGKGSIWMSGAGLSSDGNGNIFAGVANGTFDASSGGVDYGDSAIQFTFTSSGLVVEDYFTPGDQLHLETSDNDMGMSGVLLLPTQTGPIANLLATSDKSGTIYLINRDKMGGYTTPDDSSLQAFSNGGFSIHSAYAYFNNTLYIAPDSGPMQAWTLDTDTDLFLKTPQSKSPTNLGTSQPSGSTPSISANGTANAIVWAIDNNGYNNTPGILYAFNAANLATEYYNSSQAANKRDVAFISVKFTTPTIANGRVYVGGENGVAVYGLLNTSTSPAATPQFSVQGGTYTSTLSVKLSDTTSGAKIYYTTDGTPPSTSSTEYTKAISVDASETIEAIAVATGHTVSAVESETYMIDLPPTATPKISPAAGTYTGTQSVTISDATSGATIYYTVNGIAPTTSSTKYTTAISVTSSETIEAIAIASGYTESAVASSAYTIDVPPDTTVSLASVANLIAIYSDGTKFSASGGFTGAGSAYSSNLLGSSITYAGIKYAIGTANKKNVVKGAGAPKIPLPSGKYTTLSFLAAAAVAGQPSVTFTVTYTDGSKTKFTQGISDWVTPQHYSGESIALASSYCDTSSGGRTTNTYNLYQYSLTLNSAKKVKSLTMPANAHVELVAVALTPIN
jgi:hypothetical protein